MNITPQIVAASSMLALLAACSAAPTESTLTTEDPLGMAPPQRPVPAWPVEEPTYCGSLAVTCSATELVYHNSSDPLEALGCTPPIHLVWQSFVASGEALYSLCYDAPDVRAELGVLDAPMCIHCLPQAPSGQVWVQATPWAKKKPNCPSGCPAPGGPTHTGAHT